MPESDGPGGGEKGREKATLCARDRGIIEFGPEALWQGSVGRESRTVSMRSKTADEHEGSEATVGAIVLPHEAPVVARPTRRSSRRPLPPDWRSSTACCVSRHPLRGRYSSC